MENQKSKKIVLTGLFICLGLVIPYFSGHAFGVPGNVFLPMHLPVLISGLILGPYYGAACGLITPIVSSVLTGMPALWPVLPMMTGELVTYGVLTGLLRSRAKWNIYAAMITAMIGGRIVSSIIFSIIMLPPGPSVVLLNMGTTLLTGLPGIIIQLLVVPVAVKLLERTAVPMTYVRTNENLDRVSQVISNKAVKRIAQGKATLVLVKDGKIVYEVSGPGVKPLLDLMQKPETRELLKGAHVFDKIVGKAAAMIMVFGGVKSIYGLTMSRLGEEYLKNRSIDFRNDRVVDIISNRDRTGICPIEKSVLDLEDPQEGYERILQERQILLSKTS